MSVEGLADAEETDEKDTRLENLDYNLKCKKKALKNIALDNQYRGREHRKALSKMQSRLR